MDHNQPENVAGNYYNKYETKNPIARYLVNGFFKAFDYFTKTDNSMSIFEIGCGEGMLAQRMADMGHKVHATDVDSNIIQMAKQLHGSSEKNLKFNVQSIYDLESGSLSSYDMVICCEVFEHLPDPKKALDVLYKSGAKNILLSVPREPLWRVLNLVRFKYIPDLGNTPGHLNHWSSHGFMRFVQTHYSIEETLKPIPWTFLHISRND